jgi:hypothetical protein
MTEPKAKTEKPAEPATVRRPGDQPDKAISEGVILPEEMREKETDPKKVEINKNVTS